MAFLMETRRTPPSRKQNIKWKKLFQDSDGYTAEIIRKMRPFIYLKTIYPKYWGEMVRKWCSSNLRINIAIAWRV